MKSEKLAQEISVEQKRYTIAQELYDIEHDIELFDARAKLLRAELLENLTSQGVRRIDLQSGDSYVVSKRQTLEVKDVAKAEAWADSNSCWKLDTTKAWKVLRRELKLPKFFGVKETEYLTIKRSKEEEVEE